MDARQLDRFRRRLEAARVDADRRIAEDRQVAATVVNPDDDREDQAVESHDADVALAFAERQTDRHDAIDDALARIADGTYGVCEDCGGEIPLARLGAEPTATRCTACQARREVGRAPTL